MRLADRWFSFRFALFNRIEGWLLGREVGEIGLPGCKVVRTYYREITDWPAFYAQCVTPFLTIKQRGYMWQSKLLSQTPQRLTIEVPIDSWVEAQEIAEAVGGLERVIGSPIFVVPRPADEVLARVAEEARQKQRRETQLLQLLQMERAAARERGIH